MTSVLSPIAPATGIARDALTALLSSGPRAAAPVSTVESARAVPPAEAPNRAELARNQTQRERPVGPPPSFEINVLQDIRTRLAEPPEAALPVRAEDPEPPDSEVEAAEAPERPEPPARTAVSSEAEPPHLLDRKV